LVAVYPQYPWKPWLFDKVPQGYWEDIGNRKEYFAYIREKYIKSEEDWYNLRVSEINERQLKSLLMSYYKNSLSRALQDLFPGILRRRGCVDIGRSEFANLAIFASSARILVRYEKSEKIL
jgi:hypothetical protein